LYDIHLEIRTGEVLGILGESGCGKSTLANAALRLLPRHANCEAGEILFRGRDLLKLSESELCTIRGREISLVPQDPALSLNPVMTAGTQIREVLRAHLPFAAKQRTERVFDLLQAVGFDQPDDIYHAYPHQLSGGQRQRVAIAQAVACWPALVIADEPTSRLDSALRSEIVGLLSALRRHDGTAILAISHDPGMFVGFADRIAVMYAGRIVEIGTCADVFEKPLHPYTQALVRIAKSARAARRHASDRFEAIAGDPPEPTLAISGCAFTPRCPERMEICTREYPGVVALEPTRCVSCFRYAE
jgi:oligopeptide/dipeptide ABC transporter ATP-binding protein